jgi:RND family efflux transporter MFP subunit
MQSSYRTTLFVSCLFLASAVTSGCHQEEAGSAGPEHPTVVATQPVRRPVVEYAYFTGQVQAVDSVQVRARVTGYLQKICYQPSTVVKKGDLLFEIDPSQYQAQVDTAASKVAVAKAQVIEAKAKVVQAQAQVELNRSTLAINKNVAKTPGAISKQKLDENEAAVKESEAALEAIKATVLALEASVKAAEAELEYNQLNLNWTKVKSPITGQVDRNFLTMGNLVSANVTVLTNIVATDDVYVYFDVDELTYLQVRRKIREGVFADPNKVPIAVALQDEQGYPHEGMMDVVANALSMGTGTMQVRAVLKNPKNILTPGNFVRVQVPLDKARDKLLVPDRAVIYEQGDTFLLIVDSKNMVDKRKVKIGPLDSNEKSLRVIEEGVKTDDQVIIQGRQRVRPGIEVKVERVEPKKS